MNIYLGRYLGTYLSTWEPGADQGCFSCQCQRCGRGIPVPPLCWVRELEELFYSAHMQRRRTCCFTLDTLPTMNIFNENNLLDPSSLDSGQSCHILPASACDKSDNQSGYQQEDVM